MLQAYGHQPHHHRRGISAVWDDYHHDNCASMDSIHIRRLSDQQHTPLRRRSSITGTTMLPAVTEESRSSPPRHVYKVMIDMASHCVLCCYDNRWCTLVTVVLVRVQSSDGYHLVVFNQE